MESIFDRMKHYKLFHPNIEIIYYNENVDKLPRSLRANPETLIPELFGVEHDLISFHSSNNLHISAWGFIGATDVAIAKFVLAVNGRPIQHHQLKRALRNSYKAFLGVQACRSIYLSLVLDPDLVDFNIDPKKSTVGLSMDISEKLSAEITHSLHRAQVRSKDSENRKSLQESPITIVLPDTISKYQFIGEIPETNPVCLMIVASSRIFVINSCQLPSGMEFESDIRSCQDQFIKLKETVPSFTLHGVDIGLCVICSDR